MVKRHLAYVIDANCYAEVRKEIRKGPQRLNSPHLEGCPTGGVVQV